MLKKKTVKLRAYPTADQKALLAQAFGSSRYMYNLIFTYVVNMIKNKERWNDTVVLHNVRDMIRENAFISNYIERDVVFCQMRKVKQVYDNLIKYEAQAGVATVKSKKDTKQSFTCTSTDAEGVVGKRIHVPKIGFLHYKDNTEVLGPIDEYTISREGEDYFISVTYGTTGELEPKRQFDKNQEKKVRIDYASLSGVVDDIDDGSFFDAKKEREALSVLMKSLSTMRKVERHIIRIQHTDKLLPVAKAFVKNVKELTAVAKKTNVSEAADKLADEMIDELTNMIDGKCIKINTRCMSNSVLSELSDRSQYLSKECRVLMQRISDLLNPFNGEDKGGRRFDKKVFNNRASEEIKADSDEYGSLKFSNKNSYKKLNNNKKLNYNKKSLKNKTKANIKRVVHTACQRILSESKAKYVRIVGGVSEVSAPWKRQLVELLGKLCAREGRELITHESQKKHTPKVHLNRKKVHYKEGPDKAMIKRCYCGLRRTLCLGRVAPLNPAWKAIAIN